MRMSHNRELLKGSIRLLILRLLRTRTMYGYELIQEVQAELQSQLEDSMNEAHREGYDDQEAERIALAHFGSPQPVSRGFAIVYGLERVRFYIMAFGLLIFSSIFAVSGSTYVVQQIVVTNLGLHHRTWCFSAAHLVSELLLVAGIIIGYFGLFFARRLFSPRSMLKGF